MKHSIVILVTLGLACSPNFAQDNSNTNPAAGANVNAREGLRRAIALEAQGDFDAAITVATRLTDSGQFTGAALGRADIVLGIAYKESGKFIEAQHAFEKSLRLLESDREHRDDFASALSNYAGLYSSFGQNEIAVSMWQKALQLREQIGDHAGEMLSLVDLAGAALAQKRLKEARVYLDRAADEMKLASTSVGYPTGNSTDGLTDDELRVFFETEGWLALDEGNTHAAVAAYQRALELCAHARGERHWLTGWDYMLLGKAYAQAGKDSQALTDMREGFDIIGASVPHKRPDYFVAELAYSRVLDRSGAHLEAARLRETAEQGRKDFYSGHCAGCTISTAGLR